MGLWSRFFGPPSEDDFAKRMRAGIQRANPRYVAAYDQGQFRLELSEDGKAAGLVNLRNLFNEYSRLTRKERASWLQRTCLGLCHRVESPEEFEDAKPDIFPSIRTRSFIEIMERDAQLEGTERIPVAHAAITEHLIVCLVYDLPNSMQFITEEQLGKWHISFYEALETARHNLDEKAGRVLAADEKVFIIDSGDAYDGTRLLQTEKIRSLPVQGDPIALPVSRDCLLLTGSDDVEGLGLMAALGTAKAEEPRPLCPIPLRLEGEQWEAWSLAEDHPHYELFHHLELQYLGGEYAEQKAQLDKLHERDGVDVFTASFSAINRDDKVRSFCTWSKSIVSRLPKTDLIAFFDPDDNSGGLVPWDRVQATVGYMLRPLEGYPQRWEVDDFPSREQLEAMQAEKL